MGINRWASGPNELLEHAVVHYQEGKAFDYRIAFLSIDNSIELIMKVFLRLPKRVRGSRGPSKRELDENAGSFPGLLELLQRYAGSRIAQDDLNDLEYFHRLRNQLYHEAPGLTVSPEDVDTYLQLGKMMMKELLDSTPVGLVERAQPTDRGRFLLAWNELIDHIFGMAHQLDPVESNTGRSLQKAINILEEENIFLENDKEQVSEIAEMRNATVHGQGGVQESDLHDVLLNLYRLIGQLRFARHGRSGHRTEKDLHEEISPEAIELLVSSLPGGELRLLEVDQITRPWIRAGDRDFFDPDDPSVSETYFEALRLLLQNGFVRHESRQMYLLTSAGFELAKRHNP